VDSGAEDKQHRHPCCQAQMAFLYDCAELIKTAPAVPAGLLAVGRLQPIGAVISCV